MRSTKAPISVRDDAQCASCLADCIYRASYHLQVLWTFSIYLEAVAILPQLILLQRTQNIDNLTGNYVALLGSYRAFYVLNWWAVLIIYPSNRAQRRIVRR